MVSLLSALIACGGFAEAPSSAGADGVSTGDAESEITLQVETDVATLRGPAFGTLFVIKLAAPPEQHALVAFRSQIAETIDRLNRQMSLWNSESELSRFNRDSSEEWIPVSKDTETVVRAALKLRTETDGAFDPTVGPLLALWSFGPGHPPQRVPLEADIDQARQLVGATIDVRNEPFPALRKPAEGVQLDLNALAKGYAVDLFAQLAERVSDVGYMVEIGGEVRTGGTKPGGRPWRIAIEQPVTGRRAVRQAIELDNAALATSGDYRNYYEIDGRRFSHMIDPRTGQPIEHRLASVSVVADDCMTADAWATALMVLGPEEGYNLAERRQVAALFLVREGGRFVARTTAGFPELISLESAMPDANWTTFLLAAAVFAIAVAGMAIGAIVSRRSLRGSCGGLNGLKDDQGRPMCDACTTPPEECDEFRNQVAANESAATKSG